MGFLNKFYIANGKATKGFYFKSVGRFLIRWAILLENALCITSTLVQ
jgi:hypothetical protein